MLQLKGITKDYKVADTKVRALKGIDLAFRTSEFVSILGPSGCGKTTMLNIIGGLDKYTEGDLKIAGRSTKEFKDRDWDVYRNHRVGFIFQSYNLIPHQTVLGNVELALTIAGIDKAERTRRAKQALDKVGLTEQYNKRPNQLSGGQSQRVAIARALVNDPEILLADEPTGALDTTTSVQIMDLIKEIAKEKLVIMVTHNPELAEQYSTRIIKLLDGELISDSNSYSLEQEELDAKEALQKAAEIKAAEEKATGKKVKKEKAKMSFFTSFRLSLQNLFTKKARTIMTSIAGSIGIVGVSLVLAMSYGVTSYINNMQEDMLSGNPITISQTSLDLNSLMDDSTWKQQADSIDIVDGYVNVYGMIESLMKSASSMDNLLVQNEISAEYIQFLNEIPKEYLSLLFYNYGIDVSNNIYTDFKVDKDSATQNISLSALESTYTAVLGETEYSQFSQYISSLSAVFRQQPSADDYILSQYDLVSGEISKEKNQVMIVLNSDSELSDILLARLGYYTQEEFLNLTYRAAMNSDLEGSDKAAELYDDELYKSKERFSYDDLLGKTFTYYPNDTVYAETESSEFKTVYVNDVEVSGLFPKNVFNPFEYQYDSATFSAEQKKIDSVDMEVVGILVPKDGLMFGSLSSGFYYTDALAQHILDSNKDSKIVDYVKSGENLLASSGSITSATALDISVATETLTPQMLMALQMKGVDTTKEKMTFAIRNAGVTYEMSYDYNGELKPKKLFFVGSSSSLSMFSDLFSSMTETTIPAMYTLSLNNLGGNSIPSSISIYPVDFDQKDKVLSYLDKWNSNETLTIGGVAITADNRENITYSDPLSLVIQIIGTLINVITFALIGFTALSLVVSCVMIAIITYVSVVERVKEIGVIRSLGGRKKDVSSLFNAETFIIGLVSGLIGIGVTYLLSAIVNIIVNVFSGGMVAAIAVLPWNYALIMVGVSILLTLISGFFPSRSAAKKDPVVALRTE